MYEISGFSLTDKSFPYYAENREDVIAMLRHELWQTVAELPNLQAIFGYKIEEFCYEIDEEKLSITVFCGKLNILRCEAVELHPRKAVHGKDMILEAVCEDGKRSSHAVIVTDGYKVIKDLETERFLKGKTIVQTHLYEPEEWLEKQKKS